MTTQFIKVGYLVDGSGAQINKDMVLEVKDTFISAIEPFDERHVASNTLIDLSYATILPPLIDSHVHMAMSGATDVAMREEQLIAGCDDLEPFIEKHLEQLFKFGVLAVRDGGDRGNCVSNYLKRNDEQLYPVKILSPGSAYYRKGRYGGLIGKHPEEGESLADCYKREHRQTKFIKLVNSGLNSLKNFGWQSEPQFSREEISSFVERVAHSGSKVMVHANGERPVKAAVEAGCHSIEHGFFMGRDNLARMADKGCVWVPTVCTMKAYAEVLEYDGQQSMSDVARRNMEHQIDQLRIARELGVRVVLGTDSGSPGVLHGEAVFEEMKLFVKAGYSLAETVRCATVEPAELMGLDDMGQLSPGKPANFLVARGTPAQLPRKLSYLEDIYLGGNSSSLYRKNPHKHVSK